MVSEPSRNRPRLLAVGDGAVETGFARVTGSILSRLRDRYEVHHLACNYRGDPPRLDWPLYPAILGGDAFGVGRVAELTKKLKPDLIWMVNDLWIQQQYLELIFAADPEARVVTYSPVDAGPIDPEWLKHLPRVRASCFYTEYGRREVEKAAVEVGPIHTAVIPHGVDFEVFFPLPAADAKQKLGITESAAEESFVVLNANRNQPRKRIDLTIEGFALFAAGKPDQVKLLLHMGQKDLGWDVIKLARRFGVEERLILSGPRDGNRPSASDADLNLIYNAADVGLNTAGGEGWGLPAFEHAAAGKAQIVPAHSACGELLREAAYFLEAPDRVVQPSMLTEFHFTRPSYVAAALEDLYRDAALRQTIAKRCFENATREEYAWDAVSRRWDQLFQQVLSAPSAEIPLNWTPQLVH